MRFRGDLKSRYETLAECRRLENLNPHDEGDVFLQPLNLSPGGQRG